jgi:hypothetical protein
MAVWYILWPFGIFCGRSVYFVAVRYILWPFGIFYGYLVHFFHVLVCCNKKNLATLFVSAFDFAVIFQPCYLLFPAGAGKLEITNMEFAERTSPRNI